MNCKRNAKSPAALAGDAMKKPRLGTNDGETDDRGDKQGFFDSWVNRDERNAHHIARLTTRGLASDWAFCLSVKAGRMTPALL
jgi:hypothetical protein